MVYFVLSFALGQRTLLDTIVYTMNEYGFYSNNYVLNEILRYQVFSNIISNASGSAITEAVLTSKGTDASIILQNSTTLSEVLSPLSKLTNYKKIILSSLGFNPNTGFLANILLQIE